MVTLATLYNDLQTLISQNFYPKEDVDDLLDTKQDTLVSGTSIKTLNGNSLLGSGNIAISGSGTVDSALSTTSTNPVQNKVITTSLNGKANSSHTHTESDITNLSSDLSSINDDITSLSNSITNLVQVQELFSGQKSINNGSNTTVSHTVSACPNGYSYIWVFKEAYRCHQTDVNLNGTTLTYKLYNFSGSNSGACYTKGYLIFYPSTWNI